eukprot:RCo005871
MAFSNPCGWPDWLYHLDLACQCIYAMVGVSCLFALGYTLYRRLLFFNVFNIVKAIQCILGIVWVLGLFFGEVWSLHSMGVSAPSSALCIAPTIATFGFAQPMFLVSFILMVHVQVTDIVGRYRREYPRHNQPSGYRMVRGVLGEDPLEHPGAPKNLEGVQAQVTKHIVAKTAVGGLAPCLAQLLCVIVSTWIVNDNPRLRSALQQPSSSNSTSSGTVWVPVPCYETMTQVFFQACEVFNERLCETPGQRSVNLCRYPLFSMLSTVVVLSGFLVALAVVGRTAKPLMLNQTIQWRFGLFQVLVSILLAASVALRAASFGVEFQQFQNDYFPDFSLVLANICESVFLLLTVVCVLKS